MGRCTGFLKTTALGGLLVLFPLMLFYLLFDEILELVVAFATPIADLFPKQMMERVQFPVLVALILIFGVSFLLGLAIRLEAGRKLGAKDVDGAYDLVVECAGSDSAVSEAVQLCRPNGRLLLLGTFWDGLNLPHYAVAQKDLTKPTIRIFRINREA